MCTTRIALALVVALTGCGPGRAFLPPTEAPGTRSPTTTASPHARSEAVAPPAMVAIIVMENRSPDQVLGQPYLSRLAASSAVLSDYRAVGHPSLPNYLALTSGSTWGISDDGYHVLPSGHDLGWQLTKAGVGWRAYMEGMTDGCRSSPPPYAVKHNPFAYYGGACPPNVVDASSLASDLGAATAPRFVWVTPDLCHDDHDCSPSVGDSWLSRTVPLITGSPRFGSNGVLFIVWDEGGSQRNLAAAVVVSRHLLTHRSSAPSSAYSVLAAIEDRLGLARLGAAAGADPLTTVLPAAMP